MNGRQKTGAIGWVNVTLRFGCWSVPKKSEKSNSQHGDVHILLRP